MKAIFDEDAMNDLYYERVLYGRQIIEEKNRVMRMSNTKRKQERWNQLFPKWKSDDNYLNGDVF